MSTHLDNSDPRTPFPWRPVAIFLAITVILVAAAIFAGCQTHANEVPTTQASIAPAISAHAHAGAAGKAARAAEPFVSPAGKPFIATTISEIDAIIPDLEAQITASIEAAKRENKLAQDNADLRQSLQEANTAHTDEMNAEKKTADARWQKEHADGKWVGWKIRAIWAYFLGSLVGLVILTAIVGVAGTVFPAVWPILSVVYSFLKTVIGVVTLGAGRIAPALQWLDTKFDNAVERWRAKKASPIVFLPTPEAKP